MRNVAIKAYEILRDKLGDEKALTILEFADDKVEQMISQKKDIFLTKDDKIELIKSAKEDKMELIKAMKDDKMELVKAMKSDKIEMITQMSQNKIELITRMKEDKVDLIKWMVGFWIAQIAAIIGLYFRK